MVVDPDRLRAVVLLKSRIWPGVVAPLLLFGLLIGFGSWSRSFPFWLLVLTGVTLACAAVLRGSALLADDIGLLVERRGRLTRSYRWDEIKEAGLMPAGFGRIALMIYPHGGPYDVPGPNSPTTVGSVWVWRWWTDRQTQRRVADLLRAHGVTPLHVPGARG